MEIEELCACTRLQNSLQENKIRLINEDRFMKEKEYLRQLGFLITGKQYKKILIIMCTVLTMLALISFGGMLIMVLATTQTLLLTGFAIFSVGAFLLISASFFFIIKYAAKLQLYRHYKKYPEDFETEVDPS